MKKLIALLLVAVMALSLIACGGQGSTDQTEAEPEVELEVEGFQVGFCRKVMNPTKSIGISGYSNPDARYLKEIDGDITANAVAISDGEGNHIIWVSTDMIVANETINNNACKLLEQKVGLKPEQVIITGCHSHSGPDLADEDYKVQLTLAIADAAMGALADRKPAEMFTGSVETENLNFVKHYYHVNANGEKVYFGDNFGTAVIDDTTGHATEVDPTMHLLKFTREGGKDIVIANWRAHPHFTGGMSKYVLSSDYPGFFRMALEDQIDAHVVYFQGACGNVNSSTRLATERRTSDVRAFGNMLAQHAIDGLTNNMKQIETGTIKYYREDYYGEIRRDQDALYGPAQVILSTWRTNGYNTEAIRDMMNMYGIRSPYHASAITGNATRREADGRITFSAMSIGEDFAVVTFPGELFDTISAQTEEGSPYETTMLFGYAIHHLGYLPSAQGFEYTCYETDITRFVPGTGELLRDKYIETLNNLKNS